MIDPFQELGTRECTRRSRPTAATDDRPRSDPLRSRTTKRGPYAQLDGARSYSHCRPINVVYDAVFAGPACSLASTDGELALRSHANHARLATRGFAPHQTVDVALPSDASLTAEASRRAGDGIRSVACCVVGRERDTLVAPIPSVAPNDDALPRPSHVGVRG